LIGDKHQPRDDFYAPLAALVCRDHGFFMQGCSPVAHVLFRSSETMTIRSAALLSADT